MVILNRGGGGGPTKQTPYHRSKKRAKVGYNCLKMTKKSHFGKRTTRGGVGNPFYTLKLGSGRDVYKACLRYLDCMQAEYISLSRRRLRLNQIGNITRDYKIDGNSPEVLVCWRRV